ncbi:MAG: hypothetical protein RLZZ129_1291, partial [Verrucomicrobiota bacterium]
KPQMPVMRIFMLKISLSGKLKFKEAANLAAKPK